MAATHCDSTGQARAAQSPRGTAATNSVRVGGGGACLLKATSKPPNSGSTAASDATKKRQLSIRFIREPAASGMVEQIADDQIVRAYLAKRGYLPLRVQGTLTWFLSAVVFPFVDFFKRNGRFGLVVLLFIAVFRLSDIAMGIMANPFYLDMGYSKTDIANVAKVFGFFMTIAGSALCGVLVVKWGILRPLLMGAVAVAVTNLLFALLSTLEPSLTGLAIVISADNISGGFAATAFIAYLSSLTNRAYTATQYALFSSLMTLPGKFISGFSGVIVDGWGYLPFFIFASVIGIPAILLVILLIRRDKASSATQ